MNQWSTSVTCEDNVITNRIRQDLAKQLNVSGITVYAFVSGTVRSAILDFKQGKLTNNLTTEGNL